MKNYHRHPVTNKSISTEEYFNYVFSKTKKEKRNINLNLAN